MRIFCVVGLLLGSRVSTNFAAGVSSSAIIKEALESAGKIDNDDEKADMLKNIVMIQARTGDFAAARRTSETIAVIITSRSSRDFAIHSMKRPKERSAHTESAIWHSCVRTQLPLQQKRFRKLDSARSRSPSPDGG